MESELKTVDQRGMRALIWKRLEHPERYVEKPLFIWQGLWSDGIQQEVLLHACRDFNRGKDREEWSVFRLTSVSNSENYLNKPDSKFEGRVAGYLIHTRTLSMEHYLREVGRLVDENKGTQPLIVYLPYRYEQTAVDETCLTAEQRIFAPDFETWAKTWRDSTIPDFIRGDGYKEEIIYHWYNYFNDPDKGCATPRTWLRISSLLNCIVRLTKGFKSESYGIGNLNEDTIRSAVKSVGGISPYVVDEFVNYVKSLPNANASEN